MRSKTIALTLTTGICYLNKIILLQHLCKLFPLSLLGKIDHRAIQ